jgi:hypothetical protein
VTAVAPTLVSHITSSAGAGGHSHLGLPGTEPQRHCVLKWPSWLPLVASVLIDSMRSAIH